mgnify:FL=1
MAKVSRFATTRISASLIADYRKNDDVQDSFYLDGRLAKKREENGADVTIIGEDRGFFYSIFANNSIDTSEGSATSTVLNKMLEAVKLGNDKIDDEINDLADCAVEVGGRATIAREGVRQSYFAGIILKESEIAAVTRGGACAFLYRNNALFPLTTCDTDLVNADYHGNPVEHMTDFAAGIAGTIRYSNIAQVQTQDILIICNKEVFDAIGQRDLIKILYENDDIGEAASEIIDNARENNSNDSLQILLAHIDDVIPADRTGRLNLGLFQNQNDPLTQETTRYQPISSANQNDYNEHISKTKDTDHDADAAFKPQYPSTSFEDEPKEEIISSKTESDSTDMPFKQGENEITENDNQSFEKASDDFKHIDLSDLEDKKITSADNTEFNQVEDLDDIPIFEPVVPTSKQNSEAFDAGHHYADEDFGDVVDESFHDQTDWHNDDNDYDASYDEDDEYDEDEDYYEDNKSSNVKRNILYVILILICLVCIYALVRMFVSKGDSKKAIESETNTTIAEIVNTTDESNVRTPIQNTTADPSGKTDTEPTESSDGDKNTTDGLQVGDIGTVNIEVLNIRSVASAEGDLMGQLAQGSQVEIIDTDTDGWYEIRTDDGIQGYVSAEYLD